MRKKQQHPLVLVAGNGSSLVLLDTNKVTRKAFSTTVTPTITASWDLYQLILCEYTNKVDSEARLPARRWMAAQKMSLLGHGSTSRGVLWYKIALVVLNADGYSWLNEFAKFKRCSNSNLIVNQSSFEYRSPNASDSMLQFYE